MNKLRTALYNIFAVIGLTLLVSKMVSRLLGLKEKLTGNVWYIVGYELAILLMVLLGIYLYKQFTGEEAARAASVSSDKPEKKQLSRDEKLAESIRELRGKLPKEAV